jgi:DNA-directed RNA polymerase specialized sigma24 family protein
MAEQEGVFSTDELKSALDAFSAGDWIKLGKAADALCWGLATEGKDLLQEALARALAGKRRCPRSVPVMVFLINAMRSHQDALLRARGRDVLAQAVTVDPDDEAHAPLLSQQQDKATPDEILLANQSLATIDEVFRDHEMAQMVLMGQADGLTPHEIQTITGLGPVQYASVLRLIRRRLDKLNLGENT